MPIQQAKRRVGDDRGAWHQKERESISSPDSAKESVKRVRLFLVTRMFA